MAQGIVTTILPSADVSRHIKPKLIHFYRKTSSIAFFFFTTQQFLENFPPKKYTISSAVVGKCRCQPTKLF